MLTILSAQNNTAAFLISAVRMGGMPVTDHGSLKLGNERTTEEVSTMFIAGGANEDID